MAEVITVFVGAEVDIEEIEYLNPTELKELIGGKFRVHALSKKVALLTREPDEDEMEPNRRLSIDGRDVETIGDMLIIGWDFDRNRPLPLSDAQLEKWAAEAEAWEPLTPIEDSDDVVPEGWSALMFSPDGEVELHIPEPESEDDEVPDHVHIVVAIATRLAEDEAWAAELMAWHDARLKERADKEA